MAHSLPLQPENPGLVPQMPIVATHRRTFPRAPLCLAPSSLPVPHSDLSGPSVEVTSSWKPSQTPQHLAQNQHLIRTTVPQKTRPPNRELGVGRMVPCSRGTRRRCGAEVGLTHTSRPRSTSHPGAVASQGDLLDDGRPWDPTPVPGCGSHHSPSGRVNSRRVGSETTVWEMVFTGSNAQLTSLGRQDLMQRTVSVCSWRSLRGTRTQKQWESRNQYSQRLGSGEERQVAGQGAAGPQTQSERTAVASTAQVFYGEAPGPVLQTGSGPKRQRCPRFCLPWLCRSEALLFANCMNSAPVSTTAKHIHSFTRSTRMF